MRSPVTFTFDLEEDGQPPAGIPRYELATRRVLDFLAARDARATFFVVGELAGLRPLLVRDVAAAGHEIALHGLRHVPVTELGEVGFVDELRRGKALLEDVAQVPVRGYRAPIFSITTATPWAPARLSDAGFSYSSSVLPAGSPLFGLPGAPREPFRWADGPVELPCPLLGRGRIAVPYLGGVYLRYLPRPLLRQLAARRDGRARWSYAHPYDFDPGAPFALLPHASWTVSRILHYRRRDTFKRVEDVLGAAGTGRPLVEVAAELDRTALPVFGI